MVRIIRSLCLLIFLFLFGIETQAQVVVYRVNAGGAATEAGDISYPDWGEDQQEAENPPPIQFAKPGTPSPYVNAAAAGDQTAGRNKEHDLSGILDPAPVEALFTTQRWDLETGTPLVWSFPVTLSNTYKVVLYFSELFGEGLNTREFDVSIEGQVVEQDVDILEETGNVEKIGVVKEYQVVAGDASLNVELISSTSLPPIVSAIEIVDMSSTNQQPDVTSVDPQFNLEGDQVSLPIVATDPDQNVLVFAAENLPTGLTIDAKSGIISGLIEEGAGGIYDTRVIVVDNGSPSAGTIVHIDWDVSSGAPEVTNPLQDLDRLLGDSDDVFDLGEVFTDPAGLALTYSIIANTDPAVASASLEGSLMTLSYLTAGATDITVQARNTLNQSTNDVFNVTVQSDGFAEALVQVTPTSGLGGSTFNGGSLVVKNNSSAGIRIDKVTFDLSNSLFPDMVFDPVGTAGDSGSKCVTPNSGETEVGYVVPADICADPFLDPSEGGFNGMELEFADFDAEETFTFSVDVDPTSIKGNLNVGEAGAVGGVELMGSTVTVDFSNGSSITNDLIYIAGTQGGSESVLKPSPAGAPSIALEGVAGPTAMVTDPNQNIVVTGPAGADVWIVQLDGRLNLLGVPDGGFDIEPFEANEAIGNTWEYAGVVEGDGDVSIPVTLRMSFKDELGTGGLNHFIAVVIDEFAGRTSNQLVIELLSTSTVDMDAGWNLVSLSYEVDDPNYETLFAPALPTIPPFLWNGSGYSQHEDLQLGIGYWQEVSSSAQVSITGTDVSSVTADVAEGWNMIGGPSCVFDMANVQDPGGIIVPNTLYRYDGVYILSNTLTPNAGYWIEVSSEGSLEFDCTHTAALSAGKYNADKEPAHASFGVLRLSDGTTRASDLYFGSELTDVSAKKGYNMPPLAQDGLDARFSDNSRLLEGSEGVIEVQRQDRPLRIEMVSLPEGSVEQFYVDAYVNDEVSKSYALYKGETVTISSEKVTALKLRTSPLELESLPESFTLSGNFPNPFNPTTSIVFDLPEDATLRVQVYDLLGRQVMELSAIEMAAGANKQLQLDASSLASGTYVYRVQADMASGQRVQSGQMTLLK